VSSAGDRSAAIRLWFQVEDSGGRAVFKVDEHAVITCQ
jgi:hypothetical protein